MASLADDFVFLPQQDRGAAIGLTRRVGRVRLARRRYSIFSASKAIVHGEDISRYFRSGSALRLNAYGKLTGKPGGQRPQGEMKDDIFLFLGRRDILRPMAASSQRYTYIEIDFAKIFFIDFLHWIISDDEMIIYFQRRLSLFAMASYASIR